MRRAKEVCQEQSAEMILDTLWPRLSPYYRKCHGAQSVTDIGEGFFAVPQCKSPVLPHAAFVAGAGAGSGFSASGIVSAGPGDSEVKEDKPEMRKFPTTMMRISPAHKGASVMRSSIVKPEVAGEVVDGESLFK